MWLLFLFTQRHVTVHKLWGDDGKDLIIKFTGAGDILGHRGLGKKQLHPVSATALDDVTACFIIAEFFETSLAVNAKPAYQMVLFYAEELQKAEQNMRNMVHMNVKSRIANSIIKLTDIFGTDKNGYLKSNLSRQEIASFAGTTYELFLKY